ncbi:MAG: right-handed parallel beta-helix repeat-containing protein [Saprospiraceae bacterium]
MKNILLLIFSSLFAAQLFANTLHIGPGHPYNSLSDAADDVVPSDTILFHNGAYSGGEFIADLQGNALNTIYILAETPGLVTIVGGSNAWQLSDAAYLHIEGFVFEQQTGNGLNMDDGGSYITPSHHIIFINCTWKDMNATGNNDMLKLSGLDNFTITKCTFFNGSDGGSGIDMVGCHNGEIINNHFENMGSNAIQAKGGTQYLRIEKNFFKNCGQRSLNLGGSTDLQFFRPIDATFEAADLQVFSNIFIGSVAPIAYVGCVRVEVINNTIISPDKWVLRILQETVDPKRFEPCGNNTFRNNIIYKSNAVNTDCNTGPDTAPETFLLSNNLWYNFENPGNSAPNDLPVTDENNIVGSNPSFANVVLEAFTLLENSPAIGKGFNLVLPVTDYYGINYASPRSIGASEGNANPLKIHDTKIINIINIQPNPFHNQSTISWQDKMITHAAMEVYDNDGRIVVVQTITNGGIWITNLKPGSYQLLVKKGYKTIGVQKFIIY